MIIGDRGYGNWRYNGSISAVSLYNRLLTPTEIQSHALNTPVTPVLNYTWSGGVLTLNWTTGTLQAAPEVTGTYTNVPAATSPFIVTPTQPRSFFRLAN